MRRRTTLLLAAATLTGLGSWALALAAPRLAGPPDIKDQGNSLQVKGSVQGLESHDATITVRARGLARVSCVGPGGEEPPANARRTVVVTANATQSITAASVAGGAASFAVVAGPPTLGSAGGAGCPSDRYTARLDDVEFRSVTIRVTQDNRVVLEQTLRL